MNIFNQIPKDLSAEVFEDIVSSEHIKIERIISKGHISEKNAWYDQTQHEWVIVLQGAATIDYDDGRSFNLTTGDYLNIRAHQKHQVSWTQPDCETIWLAIHY